MIGRIEERFWSKVNKGQDCWLWTGNKNQLGYGRFHLFGSDLSAHRVAFELENGEIPDDIQVDHMCHERSCVNPAHLRPATSKQNNENLARLRRNNTSGYRGVHQSGKTGRWIAQVQHNGKHLHVGSFGTAEAAALAAEAKRLELFTHNIIDRKPKP